MRSTHCTPREGGGGLESKQISHQLRRYSYILDTTPANTFPLWHVYFTGSQQLILNEVVKSSRKLKKFSGCVQLCFTYFPLRSG